MTMDSLPELLLELSKATEAASTIEFFKAQLKSVRENDSDLIAAEKDRLADALHQAGEHIAAMAREYGVEIG
jgi:hypothetical protein